MACSRCTLSLSRASPSASAYDELQPVDAAQLVRGPLSGGSRVHQPLCENCVGSLTQQAVAEVQRKQSLLEAAGRLQVAAAPAVPVDVIRLTYEAESASVGLAAATSVLAEVLEEERRLALEEAALAEEALRWRAHAHWVQEVRNAVILRVDAAQSELERLNKSDALSDACYVWEDGKYGTISELRLGRVPGPSLSAVWEESSSALGEAALLLTRLAQLTGYSFATYQLIPLGPRSWVKGDDGAVEQLHLVRDEAAWVLPGRRADVASFNRALVGFTVCLKELCDAARQSAKGRALDMQDKLYPVKAEQLAGSPAYVDATVNGLSMQTDTSEADGARWNEACKLMACNLKWCALRSDSD